MNIENLLRDNIKIIKAYSSARDEYKDASSDMVFIDANKAEYLRYYKLVLPKLSKGGLIIADNVLWSGRVLDPKDKSDKAIHEFNERVIQDGRVESVLLTVRDGLNCIIKN